MEDRTCLQCAQPLFSQIRDLAFERACCRVPFHRHCIGNAEMERCPSCQRYAESTESLFLWNPVRHPKAPTEVVVIDETDVDGSEYEPSAKRQKEDKELNCAICLDQGTSEDQLMTTECCNQRAHVSCLRRYYKLPAKCRTEDDRDKIARELGLPNCFVCRMDERGMRPLTRSVLKAILPRLVRPWSSGYEANLAMTTFRGMLGRLVHKWLKPWKYMLALDNGRVAMRFTDGSEKSSDIPRTYVASANRVRNTIQEALRRMLPEWAGLPVGALEFTDQTCREFRLTNVTEIVIILTLSNYCKEASRSTRQNARPFELEYFNRKLSTWTCYGNYFNFDDVSDPDMTARTSYHRYTGVFENDARF